MSKVLIIDASKGSKTMLDASLKTSWSVGAAGASKSGVFAVIIHATSVQDMLEQLLRKFGPVEKVLYWVNISIRINSDTLRKIN